MVVCDKIFQIYIDKNGFYYYYVFFVEFYGNIFLDVVEIFDCKDGIIW